MKLKNHPNNITTVDEWFAICPPKKGEKQWADGRSAKELAKYMVNSLPSVPQEVETALQTLVPADAEFDWDAEYVTSLPGTGEGRNHDVILYNQDIVVTIEAKADETLGNLIKEEISGASVNKLYRISKLLDCLFQGGFKDYPELRYQLLTAAVGTLLETEKRGCKSAVMLVLVFESNGKVSDEKVLANHKDVEAFLHAANACKENNLYVIPNNMGIQLYFKEIVI